MIIQMMKQKNPENTFYIPYLQPVKTNIEQAIQEGKFTEKLELEDFVLPKEAVIYIDDQGVESIFVGGLPVQVMTEIPSGIVYLLNKETCLKVEKHIIKKDNVFIFPASEKAVV
jgi:hypothetical protein